MNTVAELKNYIQTEIANRANMVNGSGSPFPMGLPNNVQKVMDKLENEALEPSEVQELITAARNKFDIYAVAYSRPAPRVATKGGAEAAPVEAKKAAKAKAPKGPKAPRQPKAPKVHVWESAELQAEYVKKYPWAIPGSFVQKPGATGTMVTIACQADGCDKTRVVHLADLFQVRFCGATCRRASKKQ